MVMPLTTESGIAAVFPSSSFKPIWCLVRGRITPPRRAEDTLVTLSTPRLLRINTLLFDCFARNAYRAPSSPLDRQRLMRLGIGSDGVARQHEIHDVAVRRCCSDRSGIAYPRIADHHIGQDLGVVEGRKAQKRCHVPAVTAAAGISALGGAGLAAVPLAVYFQVALAV